MPRRETWRNLSLLAFALLLATAFGEAALRLLMEPSEDCYGTVLSVELPPCRLNSPYLVPVANPERDEPYEDLVVDGERITIGDLGGIARYDSLVGYAPLENVTSINGWWRTNHLGARIGADDAGDASGGSDADPTSAAVATSDADADVAADRDPHSRRVLVLGDSYAGGSRLPYEDTWAHALDAGNPDLDVVNFGMDGYGMAQSYLRYQSMRDEVPHDVVLVMFVPEADLWRDVNVRRDVGGDWRVYQVQPRFRLTDRADGEAGAGGDGGDGAGADAAARDTDGATAGTSVPEGLRLVRSPFGDPDSVPPPGPSAPTDLDREAERPLREYLRAHDRFYADARYDAPPVLGRSAVYNLLVAVYLKVRADRLRASLMAPDSEAVRISAGILRALRADAESADRRFVVAVLPHEQSLEKQDRFWRRWSRMVEAVCAGGSGGGGAGLDCVDLSTELRRLPADSIDRGYDGSHYGPRASREIARMLGGYLSTAGS